MKKLSSIIRKYFLCPHNIFGGTNHGHCPKCKAFELNEIEKSFNQHLDKEYNLRIEQQNKIDEIINKIDSKNARERELRIKEEEELKKQKIKVLYEKNKQILKNNLIRNEKSKLNYLLKLTPYDFEKEIAKMFQMDGFEATVTPQSNDGGKDIILKKNGKVYLVECKRYKKENKVGREALQKFFAAIYEYQAEGGYFITTSDFTSAAYEYPQAVNNKIQLIHSSKLSSMMQRLFPHSHLFEDYSEICLECGEQVKFSYPKIIKSQCSNGHWVFSTIDSIKSELGI